MTPPARYQPQLDTLWRLLTAKAISSKPLTSIEMLNKILNAAYPVLSMEVIPFIIAFWLMFRGFSSVGYAMDLKRYGTKEWGWYTAFGILAIVCSLIILWQPTVGAIYAVYMISFAFLIIGFFRIMLSFELKNLHKRSFRNS